MRATYKGHIDVVRMLLEKGADLDSRDQAGLSAVDWAQLKGHASVEQLLLEAGAVSADPAAPEIPIAEPSVEAPSSDVEEGPVEIENPTTEPTGANVEALVVEALIAECVAGNTELIEAILESGANVNAQDKSGRTPLTWACYKNQLSVAQLLLANHADTKIPR